MSSEPQRTFFYLDDGKEYIVELDWSGWGVWLRVRDTQTNSFSEKYIDLEHHILSEMVKLGGKLRRTET